MNTIEEAHERAYLEPSEENLRALALATLQALRVRFEDEAQDWDFLAEIEALCQEIEELGR